MVSLTTPVCDFGQSAIDFDLLGVDGKTHTLQGCTGEKGLLVMFICNHCPYVKSIREDLVSTLAELKDFGINAVAIMSNDPDDYEEDSFGNMKKISDEFDFSFPYLLDETQEVAKKYGAVCTPDFFGYNSKLELNYRGQFNASRKSYVQSSKRDLFEAMRQIAETGSGPKEQTASMGCSIKWK